MKLSIKIIILYLLVSVQSFAGIEPMINICKENPFLICTNKSKQECENAFNLTNSYCAKIFEESSIDWDNRHEHRSIFKECSNKSIVAYFDGDDENFYTCLSKTSYKKRLNKFMKELLKK